MTGSLSVLRDRLTNQTGGVHRHLSEAGGALVPACGREGDFGLEHASVTTGAWVGLETRRLSRRAIAKKAAQARWSGRKSAP